MTDAEKIKELEQELAMYKLNGAIGLYSIPLKKSILRKQPNALEHPHKGQSKLIKNFE